ncbi:MAG: peptidylprolyl isomerase [Opitutae bacterium]|jgi:cyclophilin family peptidyl-prolyl cis-trans isomerase|nr:peptidylprolyl isomerase [Opitutae bacterium]|tara:strand:- start:2598 stop:3218 length:621 start_codon:yes stop_codon:yes gene_type:complete
MKKILALATFIFPFAIGEAQAKEGLDPENTLLIDLENGQVVIEMYPDTAPKHVARIKELARAGKYDGVAFHRVIEGFMAQTGDVAFGNVKDFNKRRVGTGGSDKPDLPAEFNKRKHVRGACSMARSSNPNSANSQFFICFEAAGFLDLQYTVWGQVVKGMEYVDKIKRGAPGSGSVTDPDYMEKVAVASDTKNKDEAPEEKKKSEK